MKRKIFSVTVGIPAYNEEVNIYYILRDLLHQREDNFALKQILLYSDGSTDNTVKKAEKIRDNRLTIIDKKTRKGIAAGLNKIMELVKSDTLIVLNADIKIRDPYFIEKLIRPIREKQADLTSSKIKELRTRNFIEEILFTSMKLKTYIFEQFNGGNNVYTCHGRARAFSKKLYKHIFFPFSNGEDVYSYFYCISNNFTFQYVKDAVVFYKLPGTIDDHRKQSIRYLQSKRMLEKYFDKKQLRSHYTIPLQIMIKAFAKYFLKFPFTCILYVFLTLYLQLLSKFSKKIPEAWQISMSTKIVQ